VSTPMERVASALHSIASEAYETGYALGCKRAAQELSPPAEAVMRGEIERALANQRAEFLALIEAAQRKHHPASEAHKLCKRLLASLAEGKP